MKYLFWICLLYPFSFLAQQEEAEKYLKLYERFEEEKKYDSVILACQQLIRLDRKIARENHLDYRLAYAAFQVKNYELAVKQSKKVLPVFYIFWKTRKCANKNIRYQVLSYELADYYHEKEYAGKEYHHLSRIKRRFNYMLCGTGRQIRERNLYKRMIDCSQKMGKTKRVKRLEKQLYDLENSYSGSNF